MKKMMLVGRTGAGKTTFRQALEGEEISYQKTQAVSVLQNTIDTPGEYLENRNLYRALIVTAVSADYMVLMQAATDSQSSFAPGISTMFQKPTIGIVSKIDIAQPKEIAAAHEMLLLAGCEKIFHISNYSCEGMEQVRQWMKMLEDGTNDSENK